ncbi:MAG: hypothetical protein K6B74_06180, partial [Ruminococcus sp.]|nr:hypothetical protein [Ruminococcus sp.]
MKKITAFILALVLCAGLASCGKASEEKAAPVQTEEITTTTTTAATSETKASKEKADGTTAKAKKKKKKKTETGKAEKTDAKTTEKKKTTAKKTTAATEAPKEESPAKTANFDNGVYTLSFSESDWVSMTEFKSLVSKMAKAQNDLYKDFDFESFIGSMYFYSGDTDKSYPTNFTIATPIAQAEFANFKIEDFADMMVQSVQQQWAAQPNIDYASHDYVTHGGIKMLRIRAKAPAYNCDEFVFLANGNMCVIAVYYGG